MASVPVAPIPFDLGPRTPMHLSQIARAALIQGSEYDISEGPIPGEAISTPTPAPASVLLGEDPYVEISMEDTFEPAAFLEDPLADLLADLPAQPQPSPRPGPQTSLQPGPHSPPSSDVFEYSKVSRHGNMNIQITPYMNMHEYIHIHIHIIYEYNMY
ncbi:hypothetical protein BKA56DRAFT_187483 [Ilyonectria sp. MPI-CAGE-AT-0026]|nr:hypothetical protein BKA56DRAFT_187483 [Ilyonectria sp. MPI-CAGE-AT-0026]